MFSRESVKHERRRFSGRARVCSAVMASAAVGSVGVALTASSPALAAHASAATTTVTMASAGGLKQGSFIWDMYVGLTNGYFRQQHVKLSVVTVTDGSQAVQALTSGAAEAADVSADAFIDGINAGAPVQLGGFTSYGQDQLLVENSIKSWSQLKGQNIGTSTAALGGTDIFLVDMLKAHGLTKNNVHFETLGASPTKVQALASGAIAGTLLSEPYSTVAEQTGNAHALASTWDEPSTRWPFIAVGFSNRFVKAHPAAAQGIMTALQEAHNWLLQRKNKAKAIAMLIKYTGITNAAAQATYNVEFKEAHALITSVSPTKEEVEALLKGMGKKSTPAAAAKYLP